MEISTGGDKQQSHMVLLGLTDPPADIHKAMLRVWGINVCVR